MNVPKPYNGKDKYIFISYSHRDTDKVFPIISVLMENGFRVWYDQGIDPGSEWDENIAWHINECGYFIALISSNYLASNNCKDELNYARDLEKDRLIIYLEEVSLPAGMAMRINRLQSIFRYAYTSDAHFYAKLFEANNIGVCRETNEADKVGAKLEMKAQPAGESSQPSEGESSSGRAQTESASRAPFDFEREMSLPVKNKKKAIILAALLGIVGAHWFYLGKPVKGLIHLALCWTVVPVIFGVLDAVSFALTDNEKFKEKFKCRLN